MRHNVSLTVATIVAIIISLTACEKQNQGGNTNNEKTSNFFLYDGYSFDIKSVVSYDTGDNLLEFWLSSTEGLTTTKEIEEAGDFVVLNTHKSYLGNRDRFSGSTSDYSSIRFCNERFTKGDAGNAYIEVAIVEEVITLDFIAENLYTKAAAPTPVKLKGNYSGTYVVEEEEKYSDQWGLDRERHQISEAVYTTYEDGKDIITLSSSEGRTVNLQISPDRLNKKVTLPTNNDISDIIITCDGKKFNLNNGIGSFSIKKDENGINVEVDIKTSSSRVRVYYSGNYEDKLSKMNRYIYDYEGDSSVEGWHDIAKLMIQGSASSVKFYFSPSTGYNISTSNSTHMPILTVPTALINNGKTYVKDIANWTLSYDLMQVSQFESEEKPHAGEEDWIEISKDADGIYTIELEITATSSYMYGSSLDIFYKGAASN